jgi:hypothetical protein
MLQVLVLGYVSSYVWPVEIAQYHLGGFLNNQVLSHFRIISQAHNFFQVFFWYHYLADHFPFILHSGIWWSPFSHQYLVFHEIVNMNLRCLLYWRCELFLLRTNKSLPSQKVTTDISYCLLTNRIITHWPLDLDCIKIGFVVLICVLVYMLTMYIPIAM